MLPERLSCLYRLPTLPSKPSAGSDTALGYNNTSSFSTQLNF